MKLRKNYKHEGKVKTLHQWAKIKGIPYCELLPEIRKHGDITKAIKICAPKAAAPKVEDKIAHDGKELTLTEWAEETGTKKATLKSRLKRGWTLLRTFAKKK
jgi:hypothetical protein